MDKGASAFALTNNTLKPVLGKKKKYFITLATKRIPAKTFLC